jgi:hypothetical protein
LINIFPCHHQVCLKCSVSPFQKNDDNTLVLCRTCKRFYLKKNIYTKLGPNEIKLSKNKTFKDQNGNSVYIHILGERNKYNIYFDSRYIGEILNIDGLPKILTKKYEENYHYLYLNSISATNNLGYIILDKVIFLTYIGLNKILEDFKNDKNDHFKKWVHNILLESELI